MTETNSLVYVATELITAVKIFILKAQGEPGIFKAIDTKPTNFAHFRALIKKLGSQT